MNEEYDIKGSVQTLEQRRRWKHGLGDLPNRDSFDVEFSPAGQVLQRTEYSNSEAIYRSRRFAYDEARMLIRELEFNASGIKVAISEYEYSEGRRVCTTRDAGGIDTSRTVDELDGSRPMLSGTYDADGKAKRLKKFEYVGGALSSTVSKYYATDGGLAKTSISRFDSFGRLVEAFGLKPDGGPTGDGRYVHEYDNEGRLRRILCYNDLADTKVPNSARDFVYRCDERGNWTERREYHRFTSHSDWTKRITTRRLMYYGLD